MNMKNMVALLALTSGIASQPVKAISTQNLAISAGFVAGATTLSAIKLYMDSCHELKIAPTIGGYFEFIKKQAQLAYHPETRELLTSESCLLLAGLTVSTVLTTATLTKLGYKKFAHTPVPPASQPAPQPGPVPPPALTEAELKAVARAEKLAKAVIGLAEIKKQADAAEKATALKIIFDILKTKKAAAPAVELTDEQKAVEANKETLAPLFNHWMQMVQAKNAAAPVVEGDAATSDTTLNTNDKKEEKKETEAVADNTKPVDVTNLEHVDMTKLLIKELQEELKTTRTNATPDQKAIAQLEENLHAAYIKNLVEQRKAIAEALTTEQNAERIKELKLQELAAKMTYYAQEISLEEDRAKSDAKYLARLKKDQATVIAADTKLRLGL